MPHKALFLDRDGVINQEINYLYRIEDVRWVEGIFPLCRAAQSLGYKLIIVTNQSGIGQGLYTSAQFEHLMAWMTAEFLKQGITLTAVYHCPFHPEHGVGPWKRDHEDRKPAPGMLLRAARDHALDLPQSILVGDRCSDLAAAQAAGLRAAYLLPGTEPNPCPQPHTVLDSLTTLIPHL